MSAGDIPDWSLSVVDAIMQTVRAKDEETFWHCVRVGRGSRLLAKHMGLNDYEQKIAEFSGLFHDVGKVGIPESILLKPAKLTDEEYKVMMSHPEISVQILKPLTTEEFFSQLVPGVLHHHERFDGKGYPHKVFGEEIPLFARIILVADTFDAMTADRAYRKGLSKEKAYQELKDFAGRQFDPKLVEIFLSAQPRWQKEEKKVEIEQVAMLLKSAA